MKNPRRQLLVLGLLVLLLALLAGSAYLFIPFEQLSPPGMPISPQILATPRPLIALIEALIVLVPYSVIALLGFILARALQLPGTYREGATWVDWFWQPMALGLGLGVVLVLLDRVFAALGVKLSHPEFPFSIIASATAGIGEEILYRSFVLGLWAWLASLVLRRWNARTQALWFGNVIAALVFGAAHLPSAMILAGVASPAQLGAPEIVELFLLNGLIGLLCGERMFKNGLVAAVGIHFWADIVWHVVWPLL